MEALCSPKNEGGLGFKLFQNIDIAFLEKLTWKMAATKNDFQVSCFHSKYIKNSNFLNMDDILGSWAWRGIQDDKQLIKHGTCWIVSLGNSNLALKDCWVLIIDGFPPKIKKDTIPSYDLKVSKLMLENQGYGM